MTTSLVDPTYTGRFRLSLASLTPPKNITDTISFQGKRTPALRLGGRAARFSTQAMFRDIHNIGYSRFDDKGSVLMANIDAVLNLSGHIGGYYAQGTEDNNQSFYSLLLEDHTLEMHSYMQWRRPLSVSRVVLARALTKPQLKTAQLDTILKSDIATVLTLKPCGGYQVVGQIAYGGGDSLTGNLSVTLRDLVSVTLVSLATMHSKNGKGFVVFPFQVGQEISGTMTMESIFDFALLCTLLFQKVWCFRPYLCDDLVCIGFAEPRADPAKGSIDEQYLLAMWEAMKLMPDLTKMKKTPTSSVNPEIAHLADLNIDDKKENPKDDHSMLVKLDGSKNFSRLFDGSNLTILAPELTQQVRWVLSTAADTKMFRDRVEVLGRWQLPDSVETSVYPF